MSVWNPDNIKDVAESVGISALSEDVLQALSSDVEYRLSQVLEEAMKFMRHSKRTLLTTQDVSQALRVLDVEPLYGYESTRPLRFEEASIGPGQPLFYVEDEEVDFEKLINLPLPKVPREISFTAHWLAVEGVQPSIPQNPTTADSRNQELLPKGPGANSNLAAISGNDNVTVKPLVKHILSKELQLYFEKICSAFLDESNEEYRIAALASLRTDPGLHQLVPYLVQFVAEKVTHNLKNLFVLTQMMHLTSAMLENDSLNIDPYASSLVPPVLTCLIGSRLGTESTRLAHFPLRALSASLLGLIAKKYSKSSHTLKPRLARTCLKHFLDPTKPFGSHYGAIMGLQSFDGKEVVRALVVPNLAEYGTLLQEAIEGGGGGGDAAGMKREELRRDEAGMVVGAILGALGSLEEDYVGGLGVNGTGGDGREEEMLKSKVSEKIGPFLAGRIVGLGRPRLMKAIVEA